MTGPSEAEDFFHAFDREDGNWLVRRTVGHSNAKVGNFADIARKVAGSELAVAGILDRDAVALIVTEEETILEVNDKHPDYQAVNRVAELIMQQIPVVALAERLYRDHPEEIRAHLLGKDDQECYQRGVKLGMKLAEQVLKDPNLMPSKQAGRRNRD